MSTDYEILIVGNDYWKQVDNDTAHVAKLEAWLKERYTEELGWTDPFFNLIHNQDPSGGRRIWYCSYVKDLPEQEFLEAVASFQWSDYVMVMIGANSDPMYVAFDNRGVKG